MHNNVIAMHQRVSNRHEQYDCYSTEISIDVDCNSCSASNGFDHRSQKVLESVGQ